MPDHEHLEHPFNRAGRDGKTHHHSHVLPG
jgi:hypothetical protein